ncbi:MAG TPA: LamG domain-containing protein [Pirellulaceae bacterium]|nr:LamG domain-containing protein [Pirellulaceae bacterium]
MISLFGLLLHTTALAACCIGQSPDDARPPALGMAGYWRFDREAAPDAEGAVNDHSPHGHQATLRPGAVTGSNGKIGGALVLDGKGGSAECPDAVALNPQRQLTLMSWFRLEKGTLESQKILVGKGATRHADPYYQYAIAAMDRDDIPATLTFYATVNDTLQSCSARDLPLDLYTGWHHVAGTFDGQTMRLYLNGREVAAANASGTLSTYATPLVMGAYGNLPRSAAYGLAGVLDDVAVYSRPLSANEIGNYYWRAQRDLILSRPGTGETFGSVADDHVAAQPFTALGPALVSAAIWLAEANDDELLVQVREADAEGRILAAASLSAGPVGKRVIPFDPPVAMQTKQIYVLRVSAGAPGTTRGAVQQQAAGAAAKGLTETGPSDRAMATELRFLPCGLRIASGARRIRPKTEADMRYEASLNAALNAKRDVWGERLIASAEGPTYENIVDYLRPMLWIGDYVTTSGVYYLVFGRHDSVTGGGDGALHVADGSEIISRHHKTGRRTTFFVGSDGNERYGTDLHRLDGPKLHQGYQPVLLTEYQDRDGGRWQQESFATQIPETDSLVSFVRITRLADPAGGKPVKLRIRTTLTDAVVQDNRIVSRGSSVLIFQLGAEFEPPYVTYTFPESSREATVFLVRLNQPAACKTVVLDARRFAAERDAVCRFWDEQLGRGAVFDVPERRVMDAMRNLLIQNLFMTWRYSIGNAYESWYPQESGDALKALGEYGFLDEYRENLQVLLPRTFRGEDERVVEYAHKLFYTAHCARLTADHAWLAANRTLVKRWIEGMRDVIANDPQGLLGMTRAGDIHTHRYYSNHQAIGWRGLRDMASLCADQGWQDDASVAAGAADSLRTAFLKTFDATKVDMPDGTLFFPKVLKDSPATPYDPITATRLGSYWNLSIGTTLKSGIFDPRGDTMRRTMDYMLLHGARLLGLTRFNYYPVPIGSYRAGGLPGYSTSGADNVYGPGILDALAELDEADQIVLSLYGKLAHGMTRNTFISGEGDSFGVVPGQHFRALYLPPSNTNNALFLKTLHDMLVFTHVDAEGRPEELLLTHFTPRGWLEDGKTIRVEHAPTMFGPVSFTIRSQLDDGVVEAEVVPPSRLPPKRLELRLRVPVTHKLQSVRVNGQQHTQIDVARGTISLSDLTGTVRVVATFTPK